MVHWGPLDGPPARLSHSSWCNVALSVLQTLGKDRIIFVTKEDHETPSNAELVADDPNDPYEEH
ncbi:CHCHD4, partial [Cervus elaphus hippelaphus]